MGQNEKFLAVDFGAASIKFCEMELGGDGAMTMSLFAYREYEDELTDETRQGVIEGVLRQMILESGAHARRAVISISGQSALLRFGKITAATTNKRQIKQLAEFEAKRNIPFKPTEITMDYQLIAGSMEDQENHAIDVMSVVIKNSVVNQFIQAAKTVGLEPLLVDLAPIACYNAARFNNLGENECTLMVSIGGRSTNLMFIDGERFYARTIPIAGHSITQQLSKEFGIGLPEAEELKRHHGYVALTDETGTSTDDHSTTATNVAKVVRNVFIRLYGEISRSINIYRAQQHGNAPTKIYLTGGSSTIPYCDKFFSEKFKLPVEYFNPMRAIVLSENIDKTRLGEVGHTFGETIGLAIRYAQTCPIEINLLPATIRRMQMFKAKRHYLAVVLICLIGILCMICSANFYATGQTEKLLVEYRDKWGEYEQPYKDITRAVKDSESALNRVKDIRSFMTERAIVPMLIEEIFRARPRKVWIDKITPIFGDIKPVESMTLGDEAPQREEMSMDMPPMMMNGEEAPVQDNSEKLSGFTIIAHTIADSESAVVSNNPIAQEPVYPFSLPDVPAENKEENANKKEIQDQSGEYLFVQNLQKSRLFSKDPKLTVLTKRQNSPCLKNGYDFEIQLKIDFEVKSHKWTFTPYSGNAAPVRRSRGRR